MWKKAWQKNCAFFLFAQTDVRRYNEEKTIWEKTYADSDKTRRNFKIN